MMMSVAAFPLIPSCPQKLGDPYDDLAENVPEELTRFIWRNFGSMHFDDFLIGGLVVASGMEPYTALTIGDSNDLEDHHSNGSPFWSYKVCGSQIFYSKGRLRGGSGMRCGGIGLNFGVCSRYQTFHDKPSRITWLVFRVRLRGEMLLACLR